MTSKWSTLALALVAMAACEQGNQIQPVPDSGEPPPPVTDTCIDNDGDGVPGTGECLTAPSVDCNDNDALAFPGAAERCNQADDDCDGEVDEDLPDHPFFEDLDAARPSRQSSSPAAAASPQAARTGFAWARR
jgi:hypothetical protein